MKIFKNVKYTGMRVHDEAGFKCTCYEDENGVDWYIERKSWTGGVIATYGGADPYVAAYSPVALDYVPVEGQTLYEVDNSTIPEKEIMKLLGHYRFDGTTFTARPEMLEDPAAKRTKEDILADLERLKAELLNL